MTSPADRRIQIPSLVSTTGRRTTIGFDFGTHSTKLVLGVRGQEQRYGLVLDNPAPRYPSCASPSLVRLTPEGRLLFGTAALAGPSDGLFRSLKVLLLPPDRPAMEPGRGEPSPELLIAAYFAWILGRLRDALPPKHPLAMNVAAPMNSEETPHLRESYLRVIQAAWLAVFGTKPVAVGQNVALNAIHAPLAELLNRPVPPLGERPFDVKPETFAPLVSLRQTAAVALRGFYLTVDMGAGTTEVSVTHLAGSQQEHGLICFADKSERLGGDDYAAGAETEAELNDKLERLIREVWVEAYRRGDTGTRTSRTEFMHLFTRFAGGGLRRRGLARFVNGLEPPKKMFGDPRGVRCEPGVWHNPVSVAGIEGPDREFLAVADGLAVERQKWPDYVKVKDKPVAWRPDIDPFEVPYSLS